MDLVINYATIAFRPFEEAGEFVNIGIVAVEAQSRFLSFRLLPPQRTKRIRAAFPELDLALYRTGIRRIEHELSALAIETNMWGGDESKRQGAGSPGQIDLFEKTGGVELFQQLTRPRKASFFYATKGTRLTDDIDTAVDALFSRYVEHQNLTPVDYEEKRLTRDIRVILKKGGLDKFYKDAGYIGTDLYRVGIPLVFHPSDEKLPLKAIKPLNLAQSSPTRIYTHGDEWIAKVRRLKRLKRLPKEFLFTVNMPSDEDSKIAAKDICRGLEKVGAIVAELSEKERILEFAHVDANEEFTLRGE
ncbi:MAG: DUF3037 domain-containing protein [Verrucomicrobiota bacterium]